MSLDIFESEKAVRDVIEAADFIAQVRGLDASDMFLNAVRETYELIAFMPRIGAPRDYDNPEFAGMRMLPMPRYSNYLIFYILTDEQVRILRVLHSSRNIQEIFNPVE
jgi:toxin ParE1/3/4